MGLILASDAEEFKKYMKELADGVADGTIIFDKKDEIDEIPSDENLRRLGIRTDFTLAEIRTDFSLDEIMANPITMPPTKASESQGNESDGDVAKEDGERDEA